MHIKVVIDGLASKADEKSLEWMTIAGKAAIALEHKLSQRIARNGEVWVKFASQKKELKLIVIYKERTWCRL